MPRTHSNSFVNASLARRVVCVCLCALLLMGLTIATIHSLHGVNHVHDHLGPRGDCTECARVSASETLLRMLAAAISCVLPGAMAGVVARRSAWGANLIHRPFTLIQLKVQFNN